MESNSGASNTAYEKMRTLDSEILVRIWQDSDQAEYSVVEQEAARKVLAERLGGAVGVSAPFVSPGTAVVVDDDDDDEEVLESGSRMASFLSTLAGVLSWLLLVLFLGLAGLSLWQNLQMGMPIQQLLVQLLTSSIYTFLIGLFYFCVLQFVSQGLSMLQDIREYTGYMVDRKG